MALPVVLVAVVQVCGRVEHLIASWSMKKVRLSIAAYRMNRL